MKLAVLLTAYLFSIVFGTYLSDSKNNFVDRLRQRLELNRLVRNLEELENYEVLKETLKKKTYGAGLRTQYFGLKEGENVCHRVILLGKLFGRSSCWTSIKRCRCGCDSLDTGAFEKRGYYSDLCPDLIEISSKRDKKDVCIDGDKRCWCYCQSIL
ncbi:DgyrCDS4346 [Dimorphilus gyrociliatus]|uniref:DgyrCDS4346 n=1 Tax=Dimorphilus gyrociliatus TaxID=2664684 RepID=A0A7I8VI60_9ANNE|nr:DgyrCDS4346 [Dimorphilus gyrociliatus]